jgi:hypothetical protein
VSGSSPQPAAHEAALRQAGNRENAGPGHRCRELCLRAQRAEPGGDTCGGLSRRVLAVRGGSLPAGSRVSRFACCLRHQFSEPSAADDTDAVPGGFLVGPVSHPGVGHERHRKTRVNSAGNSPDQLVYFSDADGL